VIALLRKADETTLVAKISILLLDMTGQLNIDRNMTAVQIAYCAKALAQSNEVEIYNLSLEDIQTCFNRGLSGSYGEIYNRMDQSVVFGWIRKYWKQRSEAVARLRDIENGNHRQNIHEVFQNDTMKEILRDVVDKVKFKEEPVVKFEERVIYPKSPFEQMVLDEWDNLSGDVYSNLKMYKGNSHDFTSYRKLRFNEEMEIEQ